MKLVLANNQSSRFTDFYAELTKQSQEGIEYAGYASLLFAFNIDGQPLQAINTQNNQPLTSYSGVYINGYLSTVELAVATALSCEYLNVPYVNKELGQAPSLSKLTGYAKLAAADVPVPPTLAGSKQAIMQAPQQLLSTMFPAVLKRADADRGIDNFKVTSFDEAQQLLADHDNRSLWILQQYVPNDGYYVLSFYGNELKFCIFRTLEARPDGNEQKAHMYKPKGGKNASLIDIANVPSTLIATAQQSMQAMNRQIGSVDCLYDSATDQAYVLEVNYNPQMVTIETFKNVRVKAFLDYFDKRW